MDRFEIVDTYYWWLADHHTGQNSREYERLCKVGEYYSPGICAHGPESQDAYDELCRRAGCDHGADHADGEER